MLEADVIISWKMPFRFARSMYHAALYALRGKPVIAPRAVQEFRRSKCRQCIHKHGFQCGLCLCALDAKIMVSSDSCPDGRWPALCDPPSSPDAES